MKFTVKQFVNVTLLLVLTLAVVGLSSKQLAGTVTPATADTSAEVITGAPPAPGAATTCPPHNFSSTVNLARNPSFEQVGPNGSPTSWIQGNTIPPPSAAKNWLMHSNNEGDLVRSQLIPTTAPGPSGSKMLRFRASGRESGLLQILQPSPSNLMFSAWIYVRSGRVTIASHADSNLQGPIAWSTRHNQWEQLRVCTDGTVPTGTFSIYNQDSAGGEFFVDRVEIRTTP